MKEFKLYDNYMTYSVLGGLALMYGLVLSLCGFFVYKFLILEQNPEVYLLLAMFLIPLVLVSFLASRQKVFSRYFIRCTINGEGIHCHGFLWGHFILPWNSVHTFGVQSRSYSYQSVKLLFFSTSQTEKTSSKELALITKNRLVFQYRNSVWEVLSSCMPEDMKIKLQDAIEHQNDGIFKR